VSTIYLDYAASTPVDPRVAAAMCECLSNPDAQGNPASATHGPGLAASDRVEAARAKVAALIGATPREIIFTSGATEANNLAVLGVARAARRARAVHGHVLSSRTEHKSVLDTCKQLEKEGFAVTLVEPDDSGRVLPETVSANLRADTLLVSLMLANNEIGVISDVAAIAELCQARGVLMHTDARQGIFLNVIVGIVGAALAGFFISPMVGLPTINQGSFSIGSLVVSLIGAVILLAVVNLLRRGSVR